MSDAEVIPYQEVQTFSRVSPFQINAVGDVQLMPAAEMATVLEEFSARRNVMVEWLVKQFQEGVHYGFPPGCGVRFTPTGEIVGPKGTTFTTKQWTPKPMLYKGGVARAIELANFRSVLTPDYEMVDRLGLPKGTLIYRCDLYRDSVLVGSGRGTASVGGEDRNINKCIKMAATRAERDAVLHAIPILATLFVVDHVGSDDPGARTNDETPDANSTPATRRDKLSLLAEVTQYLKSSGIVTPNPTPFVQQVIQDVLHKAYIETMAELDAVRQEYQRYDAETGERIPDTLFDPSGDPEMLPES